MSPQNLTMTVTIDTSELITEMEKIEKMVHPDCRLKFQILQNGLNVSVKKIKKWQFWKRHNFKIEIKPKNRFDFYMNQWRELIAKFEKGEKIK